MDFLVFSAAGLDEEERAEFTSEEMVCLTDERLNLSEVGIKLVPLFRSWIKSGGRLMLVKLWILLLEESFSFSVWIRFACCSLCSVSNRSAVLIFQRCMRS